MRSVLPDALESRLEAWIDAEIARLTLDGVPVIQLATELVARAETSLSTVALESELVSGLEWTTRCSLP